VKVQDALQSFLIAVKAAGHSPRTAHAHAQAVNALARKYPVALEHLSKDHVRFFLSNGAWSQATRLLRWKGLDAFFRFCLAEGFLASSPMEQVPRPKSPPARRPPFYTEAEIEALVRACPDWTWLGRRDAALIQTLWFTPARISEICALQWADIDWKRDTIRYHGKGNVIYDAVLFPQLAQALDRYKRLCPYREHTNVFLTQDGEAVTPHVVQLLLRRLKKRTNLAKPLYAHAFRHNFGMRTLGWGLAEDEAMHVMGHRTDAATKIYRQWIAKETALEKVRRASA
jgi:integrase